MSEAFKILEHFECTLAHTHTHAHSRAMINASTCAATCVYVYGPSIYVDRLISPDFLSRLEINCASLKVHLILSAAVASLRFMANYKLQRGNGNVQRQLATPTTTCNNLQLASTVANCACKLMSIIKWPTSLHALL